MLKQSTIEKQTPSQRKPEVIKLGIDAHNNRYVVVRQIEGSTPQPAQLFTYKALLEWIDKQTQLATSVYSAYEAGCLGYGLHRELLKRGVTNYVIRARKWKQDGSDIKTDKRDALAIVQVLDRYVAGNKQAMAVVYVPSLQEEQLRSFSRQRDSFVKERKRLQTQGICLALYYGLSLKGRWWGPRRWLTLRDQIPETVQTLLTHLRGIILALDRQIKALEQQLKQSAPKRLPMGLGQLTYVQLNREICDWKRFKNRRAIGSYTGLCPREYSSGGKRRQGSINKHGNQQVRCLLIECAWRLLKYQHNYKPVKQYYDRLLLHGSAFPSSTKKKYIVAIARQFAVDWWRVCTGRITPESLGLNLYSYPMSSKA